MQSSSKTIPNFILTVCSCDGKSNKYGEGSECKLYSGYDDDWHNGGWCYADIKTCGDAKEHTNNYGQDTGYGASRYACNRGIYIYKPEIEVFCIWA